jgi:hypothetical protein
MGAFLKAAEVQALFMYNRYSCITPSGLNWYVHLYLRDKVAVGESEGMDYATLFEPAVETAPAKYAKPAFAGWGWVRF